jgi:hypothetical protein
LTVLIAIGGAAWAINKVRGAMRATPTAEAPFWAPPPPEQPWGPPPQQASVAPFQPPPRAASLPARPATTVRPPATRAAPSAVAPVPSTGAKRYPLSSPPARPRADRSARLMRAARGPGLLSPRGGGQRRR